MWNEFEGILLVDRTNKRGGRLYHLKGSFLLCSWYINFCPLFTATFSSNSFYCKNLFSLPTLVSECFSSEVQLMIYCCHSYKTITEAQLTVSFGMNSGFVCAWISDIFIWLLGLTSIWFILACFTVIYFFKAYLAAVINTLGNQCFTQYFHINWLVSLWPNETNDPASHVSWIALERSS